MILRGDCQLSHNLKTTSQFFNYVFVFKKYREHMFQTFVRIFGYNSTKLFWFDYV